MNINEKYFLELISAAVEQRQPQNAPSQIDWKEIYSLVSAHSLFLCFYESIKRLSNPPESKFMSNLARIYSSKYKLFIQKQCLADELIEAFENKKVKVLPFKGYFIKQFYPKPEMRYSSDLDIICEDLESSKKIIFELGYKLFSEDAHTVNFTKGSLAVELHKKLFPERFNEHFLNPFDFSHKYSDFNYVYVMKDDYFYAHFIAHFAQHFATSGAGLRFITDIYLLNKNLSISDYSLIEKCGLSEFEKQMKELADCIFSGSEPDEDILKFVLYSHTSGTAQRAEDIEVYREGRIGSVGKAIFPSFDYIAKNYNIKRKSQLPYFWAKRWVDVLSSRKENVSSINSRMKTSAQTTNEINKVFEKLNIKDI